MRLRKRRTGRMVSIDEDVETEEGSMPRDLAEWRPDPEMMYGQSELAEIMRKTIQGRRLASRVVFVLRDVEGYRQRYHGRVPTEGAPPFAVATMGVCCAVV